MVCGPASPMERRCRHDRSDRWGDDAIWRETVTLAFWETGPVRWSFLPSPMLRPLFTRSWAGLPVRCDRPPLPAQAHPVRAGRMIPRSLPAVPALSPMGLARAFHPHGPSPQTHGAAIELRPAGSPGGDFQGAGERAYRHQVRRNWGARRHCGSDVRLHVS